MDKEKTSSALLEYWAKNVDSLLEYRASLPKEKESQTFIDVKYTDLAKDPISEIKRIYQHFGLEVVPQFQQNMEKWAQENPQGKHGRHSYSLKEFALTEQQINERFKKYKQHYQI